MLEPEDFRGRAKQTLLLYPRGDIAPRRLLLVGLGKREAVTAEGIRRAAATAVQQARALQVAAITVGVNGDLPLAPEVSAQAFAEGIELGAYRYWRYRTGLTTEQTFAVERATVFTRTGESKARAGIVTGQSIARGVNFARDLVNSPGYAMTPAKLGDEAVSLGERLDLKVMVLDMAQLTEQGFGGILAVGKGSANEPRFIVMEHGEAGKGAPTICLVGKGLTFDSGGL
jgi:leucyl aminopeptidase